MSSQSKLSKERLESNKGQNSDLQNIIIKNNNINDFAEDTIEYFEIAKDLQNILKNCSNLTNEQKSEYCKSQRYFIKQYLQNLNKKI
ncbi:MAG: hypothetical protein JXA99_01790 [Candidatus Lokiarchaeota archaeon]|nr:hypothetical protein [Candidatus Lokiarchaeota archaeon]